MFGVFLTKLISVKTHSLILILGLFHVFLFIILENNKVRDYISLNLKTKFNAEFKILFGLLLLFLLVGYVRMRSREYNSIFEDFYEKDIYLEGRVKEELSRNSSNIRYKIVVDKIITNSTTKNNKINNSIFFNNQNQEKIIISTDNYSEYKIGDSLGIIGTIQKPQNFITDSGIEFDYVNFLAKDDIHGIMYFVSTEILRGNQKNLFQLPFESKKYLLTKINKIISAPQSGLMSALLLGDRRSLDSEVERKFRVSGLAHVIVFSGFHVTLIILIVFRIMIMLPLFLKYSFGILISIFLALIVGLSATVVRATIMAILIIVGKMSGRNYKINRSLFLTALIMMIYNPMILFHDLSFRLSFVATFGIVNLSKNIMEWLVFLPEKFSIRQIVSVTTAAQISVLPIIIEMSGELSTISLLANLIVLPLIPLTMVSGLLAIISSIIYYPVGLFFSYAPYYLLDFQLRVVHLFSQIPFSVIGVEPMTISQTFLFYGLVVIVLRYTPSQIYKKILNLFRLTKRKRLTRAKNVH